MSDLHKPLSKTKRRQLHTMCEFYPEDDEVKVCKAGHNLAKRVNACTKDTSKMCFWAKAQRKLLLKQEIEWKLKYLNKVAGELSDNDRHWAIRMEDAYKRQGYLSDGQKQTLDGVYGRY